MKKILVTGGAGFIGHHVVEHLLKTTDAEITVLDRLDSAGTLHRLTDLEIYPKVKGRIKFVYHNLRATVNASVSHALGKPDVVLHLAAASHVDRSITDPVSFVEDNVLGTVNLLQWARTNTQLGKFIYFSTDEIFGPAPEGVAYKEDDRYRSGNPYAASKAAAEEFAVSFHNTYGLPVIVTHTMNVFGERQDPEKFIPSTLRKVLTNECVQIHANADKTKAGSRFYIHARNVASALSFILDKGVLGEKYNIVGEREIDNLALANLISEVAGCSMQFEMVDFHSSRPGHDLRYALNGEKLANLGWKAAVSFEQSLAKTIMWSMNHRREWLRL